MTHYPPINRATVPPMDRRDSYLFKAAELLELAKNEHYAKFKAEFESLALVYLRLAEQADRNTRINIPYEKPPKKDGDQAWSHRYEVVE